MSVEDGVHILCRLNDQVQHLLLGLCEVLNVGGDGDGSILRNFDAESVQRVIVVNLGLTEILKREINVGGFSNS